MFKKKQPKVTEEELMKKMEKLECKMDTMIKHQFDIVKLLQTIFLEKSFNKNINVKMSKN
ncbi:MAG: hypothetical protein ABIH00_00745 [Armatimonadota bacterium]